VFDALTSVRPYKKAWTEEEALDFLVKQKGMHFDPALVDLFIAPDAGDPGDPAALGGRACSKPLNPPFPHLYRNYRPPG
jgi:hypothetical protein